MISTDPDFSITTTQSGALTALAPHGELDLQSAGRLTEAVDVALARHPVVLAIDLRSLDFIDSSGLRAILLANARCQRAGLRFYLIRGRRQVSRLLEISGLQDILEIVDDLASAG